ncbi:MAG: PilZ domain-containing protein [Acidobacteriia bacterium]|nr:PilZ domain-containing protein [Terriglobia bacterium]
MNLAIPVFVRTRGGDGKDSLEFATAINISPGGALVVARRSLAKSASLSLEIPSAPIAAVRGMPRSARAIRAKAVWVNHLEDYHLLGLKFARPLGTDAVATPRMRLRKASSAV